MSRMQIELTSTRPDGVWTWRIAGARHPKGVVGADLLPPGAKVGDVLRVEADVELEGTTVTAVLEGPPKKQAREHLELLVDDRPFDGVTTSLLPKGARPRRSTWDGGGAERGPRGGTGGMGAAGGRPRGENSGTHGGPRREGPGSSTAPRSTDARGAPDRPGRAGPPRDERGAPRSGGPSSTSSGAGPDAGGPSGDRRRDEKARAARPTGPARPGTTRRSGEPGHFPSGPRRGAGASPQPAAAPRSKRLAPANVHRAAVLASLAPEERPVAEQLLQGGVPALRRALQEQNVKAKAEGGPEIKADAILALAEELLPKLKKAEWRDRADAAAADIDDIALRDLRSVVAGADAARDDDGRMLAKTLREALERREAQTRQEWLDEITHCLEDGRLVRALRVSARPPDARTRVPADLAARLSDAASAALAPEALADRWLTVLEAVIESPVRRSVKPVGLPTGADVSVLNAARQASGRVPALAAMLGIAMPPPPPPMRPGVRPRRPAARPARPPAPAIGARAPAPPPPGAAPATSATSVMPAAPAPPATPVTSAMPAAPAPPATPLPSAAPPAVLAAPADREPLGSAPPTHEVPPADDRPPDPDAHSGADAVAAETATTDQPA